MNSSFAVVNAGIAGCCTGLALSFPGMFAFNTHVLFLVYCYMGECGAA
jgi:hypothetical protein